MKKTALIFVLLIVIAILGGCASGVSGQQSSASAPASEAPSAAPKEEDPPVSVQPSATEKAETQAPSPSEVPEEINDTGVYQGQADNNFIEIKLDSQPEESAYMVFMLTDGMKSNFDDLQLETGECVQLRYYKNEAGQLVLVALSRLEAG